MITFLLISLGALLGLVTLAVISLIVVLSHLDYEEDD